jgi:hypothetical protein
MVCRYGPRSAQVRRIDCNYQVRITTALRYPWRCVRECLCVGRIESFGCAYSSGLDTLWKSSNWGAGLPESVMSVFDQRIEVA